MAPVLVLPEQGEELGDRDPFVLLCLALEDQAALRTVFGAEVLRRPLDVELREEPVHHQRRALLPHAPELLVSELRVREGHGVVRGNLSAT